MRQYTMYDANTLQSVSVNSGGVISRLDAALILETFVQAFLLLSFSNIVMRFVAFTLLGTKSRVYKEFGEHEVEYEREYARFAVQSIVASHAFQRLDTDGSGSISEEELVDALRAAQGPNGQSDENDLRALASYIVACGDVDGSQAGDGEADGLISATEWFDLFGSGHADSASIRENLRSLGATEIAMLRRELIDEGEGDPLAGLASEQDRSHRHQADRRRDPLGSSGPGEGATPPPRQLHRGPGEQPRFLEDPRESTHRRHVALHALPDTDHRAGQRRLRRRSPGTTTGDPHTPIAHAEQRRRQGRRRGGWR